MSPTSIAALGAIAGVTIFIGLPVGRVRNAAPRTRALLNAAATGILVFLVWDVLTHAWEPIDAALAARELGTAGASGAVLAVMFTLGLMGLVYLDRWIARRARRPVLVGQGGPTEPLPGALSPAAAHAQRLAMMIAVGIGLHNFAEGLAIGSSAASGALQLAVLLVIGFALHNATEGFGIVAPLSGTRPSWPFLIGLGLIGGGPTFLGTIVGQAFTSPVLSIAFLGLAAGSILYVVIELLAVARRSLFKTTVTWFIFIGLMAGFATDAIVTAAGA